jgi:hypothetical protein
VGQPSARLAEHVHPGDGQADDAAAAPTVFSSESANSAARSSGGTLADEEADALLPPAVREALREPIYKADMYDIEQAIAEEVAEERAQLVILGALTLEELLTDHFIGDLHALTATSGRAGSACPFTDGNGRTTRMLADLVFLAAQSREALEQYDLGGGQDAVHRLAASVRSQPRRQPLAAFNPVRALGG